MNNPINPLNIENKILHAGIFWQAFEFQAWSSTVVDDQFTKRNFYADAIEEFALTLDSNIAAADIDVDDLSSIDPATKNGAELNIFAFAVSAHKVLMYQEYLARKVPSFKKVSFLDIVEQALAKEKAYDNNLLSESDLFRFEHLALRNAKKLKYLLHARYNMLTTIALARINGIDRANILLKARYYLAKWSAQLSLKSRAEQEEIVEYMTMAQRTKNYLEKIGEKTSLNKSVKKILKNMRISTVVTKKCQKRCVQNGHKIKQLVKSLIN